MSALGYERFGVQGGDWGAGIGTWLALKYARRVVGLHLNYIPGSYAPFVDGEHTDEELAFLRGKDEWAAEAGAYGHVQRTRPLTIAYGLTDSPIGLAAWMVGPSDPSGTRRHPHEHLSLLVHEHDRVISAAVLRV
jgi:pimeloyl-ACP methyl ester carboxylesterase